MFVVVQVILCSSLLKIGDTSLNLAFVGFAGISDAYYCAECTRLEKDRDGCPKIVNLGASRYVTSCLFSLSFFSCARLTREPEENHNSSAVQDKQVLTYYHLPFQDRYVLRKKESNRLSKRIAAPLFHLCRIIPLGGCFACRLVRLLDKSSRFESHFT